MEINKEIVFSKSVKAGKRIYYLDVKKNRKDELFLTITESKKIITGEGDDVQVSFEKHKIFLYKEDFEKFTNGLTETINYINSNHTEDSEKSVTDESTYNKVKKEDDDDEIKGDEAEEKTETPTTDSITKDGDIKIDIDF
ncbi:MAG: DUF3276 family protein [Bacteroidaceae bacterium]|nr:PUR family DNA/RNA-binding protein [Bacteroidaceae bacterium]